MESILSVQGLSKSYLLSHKQTRNRYVALRDIISNIWQKRPDNEVVQKSKETFWALDDVSFDVKPGERVGIIGRNGAGKSTLLKLISRITEPTKGRIELNGRVASLLEVGTGFHPELTGRENIFLNGAILGMSMVEIRKKFDEIIGFAEVEKFLDTPVKRYSSGMYVRLAFSVAAHLESEIFLIDEVLAVGDTAFQKKCVNKMFEVSNQGRTVLFVSHNMALVKAFTTKAIVLDKGRIVCQDITQSAIDKYLGEIVEKKRVIDLDVVEKRIGEGRLRISKLIFNQNPVDFGKNIEITLYLKKKSADIECKELDFGVNIIDKNKADIIHCSNRFLDIDIDHEFDSCAYTFKIENILRPGNYSITLFLRSKQTVEDWLSEIAVLEIGEGTPYPFKEYRTIQGSIFPKFSFSAENQGQLCVE